MSLPKDVDPESRARLPLPRREELDDEGKKRYDILADPKGGSIKGLHGPGGLRLHSPKSGVLESALNNYLRTEAFDPRTRELAILVAARSFDSQFEWAAHEPTALKVGLEREVIETIKHRRGLAGLKEADATIIQFGRELFAERKVSPDTFAKALKLLGKKKLVDLITLMGNYVSTAFFLAAIDMQLPEGQQPLLPP
jgi:4-carboxymuconolactone decarboxylase